jgi:hypothetical protein
MVVKTNIEDRTKLLGKSGQSSLAPTTQAFLRDEGSHSLIQRPSDPSLFAAHIKSPPRQNPLRDFPAPKLPKAPRYVL